MKREEIKNKVLDWTNKNLKENFEFREHQLETIVDILYNILNHEYTNYIVEAPTGSGKSLINIISACVLSEYYDLTSYILVSDLFLWEQYENFIKKHKNLKIASIKGQTGNYTCLLNKEDMKNADCKMAGLSWAAMFNPKITKQYSYECAKHCAYVKARKKAIKSKVCVMTYQLFLFAMNNVEFNNDGHGNQIFSNHDILFCDECHNIPEIVQMQYAPTIKLDDFDKICNIYDGTTENELSLFDEPNKKEILSKFKDSNELKNRLLEIWKIWVNNETRNDEDQNLMNEYEDILESLSSNANEIKSNIIEKKNNKEKLSKDDIAMFKICSWYENYMCHWHDFNNAIHNSGVDYLLKTINVSNEDNHISITFRCTKEDFLVYNYLLTQAKYKVFLSATVGGKEAYDNNMGFKYDINKDKEDRFNESKMQIIPSTFDFEESPIWYLNKFKMSFKEKDISFNHLKTIIYSICSTKFKDQKGMIQTGSYAFAQQLYDNAPYEIKSRMLIYNGSREKTTMISIHQMSKNTILVGPTLNEGIDLPGDDCRFIIIMKVPYPSLGSKLVKEKIKLFPLWYNSTTSNEIIQGIGRGVRYNGDWCVTYIFDACFWNLYKSTIDQYPQELQNRIKII